MVKSHIFRKKPLLKKSIKIFFFTNKIIFTVLKQQKKGNYEKRNQVKKPYFPQKATPRKSVKSCFFPT